MRRLWILFLLGLTATPVQAQTADPEIQRGTTADGVEFGLWGNTEQKPAQVLFVLAGTIDDTLGSPYFRQCGSELATHGFVLASIDLPCHGRQSRDGERSGLAGWSDRAAGNDNFVSECNDRLSNVLDHLIQTGIADPNRIAACGTSRGGFAAIQFAAHDCRIRCVAAFAPVTNLAAISEFSGREDLSLVRQLSLKNCADQLAGRPVWVIIGDRDDRVSTDDAIEFARSVSKSSRDRELAGGVELHVLPEPRGHTTPAGAAGQAANWILKTMQNP